MGGCRCTYRNCTVRSDGSTHMFHYPVFDKIRCHQWLINAQKLEFLNLKVSQLKNRVICQHHFKDEYFMNFQKAKLKFKAIPTLNGPFCDPGSHPDYTSAQDETKIFTISLDDIETEYLTPCDKKANFSVKYGDFLTNSDLMDISTLNISNNINSKTQLLTKNQHTICEKIQKPSDVNLKDSRNKFQNSTTIHVLPKESTIVTGNNKNLIGDPSEIQCVPVQPTIIDISFDERPNLNKSDKNIIKTENNSMTNQMVHNDRSLRSKNKTKFGQSDRVKILSEKEIREPVSVTGILEPVSPSLVLRLPEKRKNVVIAKNGSRTRDENKASNINIQNNNTHCVLPNVKVEVPVNHNLFNEKTVLSNKTVLKNTVNTSIQSNKSLLKPKINQDRIAAIEEKRKFNMKLRDIIESCLNKIDDQEVEQITNKPINKNEQVGTFLSKETVLPSVHEYTIACLEARMKRMEDVLLNKIDQNSQRIVELKNFISTSDKKSISTQTINNEELQKKQLYKEISKYLSADANSLIYEELFINKYVQSSSHNISSPKRRRRR